MGPPSSHGLTIDSPFRSKMMAASTTVSWGWAVDGTLCGTRTSRSFQQPMKLLQGLSLPSLIPTLVSRRCPWLPRQSGLVSRFNKPTSLTALARFRAANTTAQHNVSLFALPSSRVVASALVDMSGVILDRFGFMWETMSAVVELATGEYVLASEEISGGDPYYFDS